MNKKLFLLTFCILFTSVFLNAQKVSLNFRYNPEAQKGNFFEWKNDSGKTKDSYDAVTGASKKRTNQYFKSVWYDSSSKKRLLPKALVSLFLYAVNSPETAVTDCWKIEQNEKQLLISFVHRGNVYRILTDENGFISLTESCAVACGAAENRGGSFFVKEEFLLPQSDPSDMNGINAELLEFVPDIADSDAPNVYSGMLKASYKKNILTVQGTLIKEPVKK